MPVTEEERCGAHGDDVFGRSAYGNMYMFWPVSAFITSVSRGRQKTITILSPYVVCLANDRLQDDDDAKRKQNGQHETCYVSFCSFYYELYTRCLFFILLFLLYSYR